VTLLQGTGTKLLYLQAFSRVSEVAATTEPPFLEILGVNITAKLAALVVVPGYVLLVHFNSLLIDGERVGVVEQRPQGTIGAPSAPVPSGSQFWIRFAESLYRNC
jgi:hypothetical protein